MSFDIERFFSRHVLQAGIMLTSSTILIAKVHVVFRALQAISLARDNTTAISQG